MILHPLVAECLKERTKVEYLYGTGNVYDSFEKMSDSYRDSVQMLQINRRGRRKHSKGERR